MKENQTSNNNEMTPTKDKAPTEDNSKQNNLSAPPETPEERQWKDRLARTDLLMAKIMKGFGGQPLAENNKTPPKPSGEMSPSTQIAKPASISHNTDRSIKKSSVTSDIKQNSGLKQKQQQGEPLSNIEKRDDKDKLNPFDVNPKKIPQEIHSKRKKLDSVPSSVMFNKDGEQKGFTSDIELQDSNQHSDNLLYETNKTKTDITTNIAQEEKKPVNKLAKKESVAQRQEKRKVEDDLAALRNVQSANNIDSIIPAINQDIEIQEKLTKSADANEIAEDAKPLQVAKKPKEVKQPTILKPTADTLGFISMVTGLETKPGTDVCDINQVDTKSDKVKEQDTSISENTQKKESAAKIIADTLECKAAPETLGFINTVLGVEAKPDISTDNEPATSFVNKTKPVAEVEPQKADVADVVDDTLKADDQEEDEEDFNSHLNIIAKKVKVVMPPTPQPILAEPQPFLAEPNQKVNQDPKPVVAAKVKKDKEPYSKKEPHLKSEPVIITDQAIISESVTDLEPEKIEVSDPKPEATLKPAVVAEPAKVVEPEKIKVSDPKPPANLKPVEVAEPAKVVKPKKVVVSDQKPVAVVEPEKVVVSDPKPVEVAEPTQFVEPEKIIVANQTTALGKKPENTNEPKVATETIVVLEPETIEVSNPEPSVTSEKPRASLEQAGGIDHNSEDISEPVETFEP
ncbi:MAG: hypothetical protein HQL71_15225, partial [Magnetococcales bacterium]|nr:hypothetical protein [Magnetococcales bacterium]